MHYLLSAKPAAFILASLAFVRLLTLPLYPIFDKTEARYAYIGELMVQTGNWITPFIDHGVPFWAKPILSFWLTAGAFSIFGINAFAARLPAFLIFIAVGWFVFLLGRERGAQKFGLAGACIFASTAVAFFFGGTVMTDPALKLGVTLVMTSYWKCVGSSNEAGGGWGYLFFIGIAIGLLAKGPIGAILPGMSIAAWMIYHHKWIETWRRLPWITGTILTILLVVPWYVLAEHRTPGFLHYFIIGEHFQRFLEPHWTGDLYGGARPRQRGTIWLFALIASLPWSAALLLLLFRQRARGQLLKIAVLSDPWSSYLLYWLLAPLVLFTFAANILLSYVATSAPAFALVIAHIWQKTCEDKDRYWFAIIAAIVPVLFLAAVTVILVDPGISYFRSQAGIVTTFKKLTAGQSAELIYVGDKPYSADFYTGGNAKFVHDIGETVATSRDDQKYFVIATDVYPTLPAETRERFEIVVDRNHYLLLRTKKPASKP